VKDKKLDSFLPSTPLDVQISIKEQFSNRYREIFQSHLGNIKYAKMKKVFIFQMAACAFHECE
jgi:hypothetical protein